MLLYMEKHFFAPMIEQLSNTEIVNLLVQELAIASRALADAAWRGMPCTHEEWEKLKQKAASIEDAAHEMKLLVGKNLKVQKLSQNETIQAAIAELFPQLLESSAEAPTDVDLVPSEEEI